MRNITSFAVSLLALATASPAVAQNDDVQVLADRDYSTLYASGWSVETMFGSSEIVSADGETIGDVENIIFSDEGDALSLIAEIGGVWDMGDTHIQVPWDRITLGDTIDRIGIPVTEETVDQYDVFGDYWLEEEVINQTETEVSGPVNDDLATGPGVFRASDLIGDYAYLSDGARYGYIADIIVIDGSIAALVTDAAAYGRPGYYAYPYRYRGVSPTAEPHYVLPEDASNPDALETFDYDELQTDGM